MADVPEGILVGLGNPLLDITISTDDVFLKKYDLKANDAILAEEKHQAMFPDMIQNFTPEYVAGGATQNSIRVAQWMLQKPNATTFFGCVGNDNEASVLREKGHEAGVNVRYQVNPSVRTGLCGAVITGEDRSLVAELGAALHFTHEFLGEADNKALIDVAKVFYVGGFPFPVSPKSVKLIAEHACDNNKTLVMNLSAPYLCKYFVDPEINIMPLIDILFCNDSEAAAFCQLAGIKSTDLEEMAKEVQKLPKKNATRSRIVVFTRGRDPTIVCVDGQVKQYPILPVEKSQIKDTNGCGDSFVGGFLSQLVQGKPVEECVRAGFYAAHTVIQYFGCTYPPKPDFK
jgi:adenosine kinase